MLPSFTPHYFHFSYRAAAAIDFLPAVSMPAACFHFQLIFHDVAILSLMLRFIDIFLSLLFFDVAMPLPMLIIFAPFLLRH